MTLCPWNSLFLKNNMERDQQQAEMKCQLNTGKEQEEPDLEFIKKISFEAGIDIIQGFVPAYSNLNSSKMENISQISSTLWQKFREPLPPGFIGEIYIINDLNLQEICLIEGIKNVQREKKIPVLFRVPFSSNALQILKFYQKQEIPNHLLVFYVQNPVSCVQQQLQNQNFSELLSIPKITICLGVLKASGPTNNPYLSQEFYTALLKKEYPAHIMITPNVVFRCNLRNYGGPGYTCSFDLFGVKQHIQFMQIFMWYQKEEKAKVALKYWNCCWCKKSFPETQESYKKFDFQYCSTKCLSEHRKQNFKFN